MPLNWNLSNELASLNSWLQLENGYITFLVETAHKTNWPTQTAIHFLQHCFFSCEACNFIPLARLLQQYQKVLLL